MPEFNLLQSYPKTKRGAVGRITTPEIIDIARKQEFDYYDGDRKYGFGGYVYDGRWQAIARLAKERYNLNENSKVLIERCEKGFLVYDIKKLIPGITVYGSHYCSEYVLNHAMEGFGRYNLIHDEERRDLSPKLIEQQAKEEIMPFLVKTDTRDLIFKGGYFDTVISINSVCGFSEEECKQAIREIKRVSKENGKNCYIHADTWTNEKEKKSMLDWILLCKTFLDKDQWIKLFKEEGYTGDYGFIIFNDNNY